MSKKERASVGRRMKNMLMAARRRAKSRRKRKTGGPFSTAGRRKSRSDQYFSFFHSSRRGTPSIRSIDYFQLKIIRWKETIVPSGQKSRMEE